MLCDWSAVLSRSSFSSVSYLRACSLCIPGLALICLETRIKRRRLRLKQSDCSSSAFELSTSRVSAFLTDRMPLSSSSSAHGQSSINLQRGRAKTFACRFSLQHADSLLLPHPLRQTSTNIISSGSFPCPISFSRSAPLSECRWQTMRLSENGAVKHLWFASLSSER